MGPEDRSGAPHVAVVGGGVLGASTAARLARGGARVTLVSDGPLAGGASGRSLSWLNSSGRHPAEYHRLRVLGLDRYRALADRGGCDAWLRFDGGLSWAAPGREQEHRDLVEHLRGVGHPAQWLAPEEVGDRTPGVDAGAVASDGAIFTPGDGWVDLPSLVVSLAREVRGHGGRVLVGQGPASIDVQGDRVTGVRVGSERVPVDAAVLATGSAVPRTVAEVGVTIPDASTVGLLVRTRPSGTALRAVLNTPRVSVRPSPGGTLVLDAGWSEAEVRARPDGTLEVLGSTVEGLVREASAVLEGHPTLVVDSLGVGPKPIPGDGAPVIGALPGIRGYHVAFTHSGATLGLIAGELLADEVLGGEPSPLLRAFRPDRFG